MSRGGWGGGVRAGDEFFLFWGERGMMWWGLPVLYFGTLVVKCMAIMICGTVHSAGGIGLWVAQWWVVQW